MEMFGYRAYIKIIVSHLIGFGIAWTLHKSNSEAN